MATVHNSALSDRVRHGHAEPWRWVDSGEGDPGRRARTGDIWLAVRPPARFETFGAIAATLAPLVEAARLRSPSLVDEHRAALTAVVPEVMGGGSDRRGLAAGADAITFAIVRRISRESLHTSTIVDGVARFLLACLREGGRRRAVVTVSQAERVDRPSLRVLYRLWALSAQRDGIAFHVGAANPATGVAAAPAARPFEERLVTARAALLARLQRLTVGGGVPAGSISTLAAPPAASGDVDAALTESAHALVNQNYELAYLWLWGAASHTTSAGQRSQLWRLTALADANLGQYGAARTAVRTAAADAVDLRYRAHLHYLDGLLSTKRFYELDEADAGFDRGLAALDAMPDEGPSPGTGEDTPAGATGTRRAALERAWLINGKALVATLRARGVEHAQERQQRLDDVLRTELEALSLVSGANGPDEVYLRFNLLANIAFLLEISGRFPEAVRFWERAFGQFLELPGHDGFEQTFGYRVGVLKAKAGDLDAALEALTRALDLAEQRSDRFSAERIAGALAHATLLRDGSAAALAPYERAAALALDNADMLAAADHLAAVLACRVEVGAADGAETVVEILQGLDVDHPAVEAVNGLEPSGMWPALVAAVRDGRFSVRPPPPKLPAYVPLIDLEPVPDEDLNRYLAGTAAPANGAGRQGGGRLRSKRGAAR